MTKNFGAENASVPLDKPRTNGFFRETVEGNIWRIGLNHRELPYESFRGNVIVYRKVRGERRGKEQKVRNWEDAKLRNATSQPLSFITSSISPQSRRSLR